MKWVVFLFFFGSGTAIFHSQSTKELQSKLQEYQSNDTVQCYWLNKNIEAENDQNIWIQYNATLKKISFEKSESERNKILKKTYLKYLSIAYNNDGAYLVYTEQYEKAILFYKKSFQISKFIIYNDGSTVALQNIGTAFDYLGKIDSTLVYLKNAYRYAKASKNESNLAYILTDLGFVNNNLGNTKLAIQYNLEALPLFEKQKDADGLERTYFALGRIFDNQNDFKTSHIYYEKCLAIDKKAVNIDRQTLVLTSLAALNIRLGNLSKAKKYNDEAFVLASKHNNIDLLAGTYKISGDLFFNQNNFEKAKENYLKAFTLYQQINSDTFISKLAIKMANATYKLNQLKEAKKYGLIAFQLSEKTNFPADIKEASEVLSEIFFQLKDFKNAYHYKKISSEIAQKIFYDESKDLALKATHRYETEKKEATIIDLNQKRKISELQSNRKSILINSFIISFIALAAMAYFLFSRFKVRKQNELLQIELADTEKLLNAEKKATESELKALKSQMNPHFIFNALNSIQAQFMYGDKVKANEQLNNFTYLTRQILEVSGKKLISIATEIDLLTKYLELEKMRFDQDFSYEITVSSAIDPDYHQLPPMLLQPFVENSIKHGLMHKKGHKKCSLHFELSENEDQLICTIIDNGIGRQKSAEIKTNSPTSHASFSTQSIEERLKLLNPKPSLQPAIMYTNLTENEEIMGTKVDIFIPMGSY